MPLQNIIITSSINSIATQSYGQRTYQASSDLESFPIEKITGSYGGVWPGFTPNTNFTVDLIVNVTQSWIETDMTALGNISYVHDTMEEFVNGEFSGSSILVTDGELSDCFFEIGVNTGLYSIFPYSRKYNNSTLIFSNLDEFLHPYTSPYPGQILMFYTDIYSGPGLSVRSTSINYLKIAKIDHNGNDNSQYLQDLERIIWVDSEITVGQVLLDIVSTTEYAGYYFYEVSSKTWTNILYFSDDNVLDYTLEATSSWTKIHEGYNYFTSSWTSSIDIANGFNTSSGYYAFPLTPNCSIELTASVGITITTSASFSLAINAYDPSTLFINASSANFSIPAPLQSTINTYILGPNAPNTTHSIVISSSNHEPIQNFRYQINAWLDTEEPPPPPVPTASFDELNTFFNMALTASTFTINDRLQYLPVTSNPAFSGQTGFGWFSKVWDQDVNAQNSNAQWDGDYSNGTVPFQFGWLSFANFVNNGIPYYYDPYIDRAGVVYALWNSTAATASYGGSNIYLDGFNSTGSVLIYNQDAVNNAINIPFGTYQLNIVIPEPFKIPVPPYSDPATPAGFSEIEQVTFGPPLAEVTISFCEERQPVTPSDYIGVIPPNQPGTFSFPFVVSTAADSAKTIAIVAPSNSRDAYYGVLTTGGGLYITGSVFMIASMSITATASTPPPPAFPQTASIHFISFDITQSQPPQQATSSFVLEPYIYTDFYNTDCDVLINNISQNDISEYVRKVEYNNGSDVPSNRLQIINNTAEFAEVNDYLYTSLASNRARYEGVRSISPDFNLAAVSGGYGATPNVESLQTYFAYFERVTTATPQLPGKSVANIKYLINKDGEIQLPSALSSSYYYNLIDNFPSNKEVEIIIQNSDENRESIGYEKVIRAGEFPKNIVTTLFDNNNPFLGVNPLVTSTSSYSNVLVFKNDEYDIPDYFFTSFGVPNGNSDIYDPPGGGISNAFTSSRIQEIAPGENDVIRFANTIVDPSSSILLDQRSISIECDVSDYTFLIKENSGLAGIFVTVFIDGGSSANNGNGGIFLTLSVEKSIDKLNWEVAGQRNVQTNSNNNTKATFAIAGIKGTYYRFKCLNTAPENFNLYVFSDSKTRVVFTESPNSTDGYIYSTGSNYFSSQTLSEHLEVQPNSTATSMGPFWVIGPNSRNILTSSVLYRYYEPDNPYTQRKYPNSSFTENFSFGVKKGDSFSITGETSNYIIEDVKTFPIQHNPALISNNFNNWTSVGTSWNITGRNRAVCNGINYGLSNAQYIFNQFNTTLAVNSLIIVEWTISNWEPAQQDEPTSDNYSRMGVGLNTNIYTTPTNPQYFRCVPLRNGKQYRILKKTTSTANDTLYFTQDNIFKGIISNVKVNILSPNFQQAKLYLKLNKNVPSGSVNINNFTISRFNPKSNFVVLDTPGIDGDGFLFPKYATNELRQNFDSVATKLQKEGLI